MMNDRTSQPRVRTRKTKRSHKHLAKREREGERRRRAQQIGNELKRLFPKPKTELTHGKVWELLVAVMLSAQCTDKKVNEVTNVLFAKYPTIDDVVRANPREFERDIHQTGLYRQKTKNILAAAKMVKKHFHGAVPRSMDELLKLPGVGRKTANVVLSSAFCASEGIAVDTHVKRLAQKFRLSTSSNPDRIERDLMELFPKEEWGALSHRLIAYGRQYCPARKHDCREHPLTKIDPPAANIWPNTQRASKNRPHQHDR